jgi:hypothetical protein
VEMPIEPIELRVALNSLNIIDDLWELHFS